jgi:methyltransferase (TIGR00027 family)
MKATQSSVTAEGIALIRAYASTRPADVRICYDPLAVRFLSPGFRLLMRFFAWYGARRSPGVTEYLITRTRVIDDALERRIGEGIQQLVILGAGFDSRAYRFEALKGKARVFEVDHPATQAVKLEKLNKIFRKIPDQVTYVPVDFEKENLAERLKTCGYREDLKTFFIWEGVIYYLEQPAIDATLEFVAKHSVPGSSIIFDYMYASALEARRRVEVRNMRRYRRFTGEDLRFGIEEGKVESFLARYGLHVIQNLGTDEFRAKYFQGSNAGRPIAPVYAIAEAGVG